MLPVVVPAGTIIPSFIVLWCAFSGRCKVCNKYGNDVYGIIHVPNNGDHDYDDDDDDDDNDTRV